MKSTSDIADKLRECIEKVIHKSDSLYTMDLSSIRNLESRVEEEAEANGINQGYYTREINKTFLPDDIIIEWLKSMGYKVIDIHELVSVKIEFVPSYEDNTITLTLKPLFKDN